MKNAQLKIKAIKTGTEIGATYCLGCQNYTHNFKPQEVKLTDKVLQEKSNCFLSIQQIKILKTKTYQQKIIKRQHKLPVCTFKKQKIVFTDYKTCKFFAKPVKNTQVTCFQKN